MSKRYTILKDLPDLDTGEIFVWCKETGVYEQERFIHLRREGKEINDTSYYWFPHRTVEKNPTWFKEITESIPAGSGTANDVLNMDEYTMKEPMGILPTSEFKKQYSDLYSKEISRNVERLRSGDKTTNFTSPKDFIESKPLNSEWEIVEFQFKDPGFRINDLWRNDDGTFGQYKIDQEVLLESPIHSIKSVKRLTDNEVFSVGDEVEYRSAENFAWDASKVWDGKIKSIKPAYNKEQLDFEIDDNHLWNDGLYPHKYIQNIRHKSTPSQPQNNKERATVTEFYFECMGTNNQKEYVLSVSRTIEHEEYPSIKQAIEQVLNSDK